MKKILFNLVPAIFLWFGSCCIATAQVAQSDEITDDSQQIIQDDSSSTGSFEPVMVDPSASSDVSLQFPQSLVGKTVSVQPLDGGVLQIGSSAVGQDGKLSFSFQVSNQPGVHRVIVFDPNAGEDSPKIVALLQFEVPSPSQ
jgi:hypothetical protein